MYSYRYMYIVHIQQSGSSVDSACTDPTTPTSPNSKGDYTTSSDLDLPPPPPDPPGYAETNRQTFAENPEYFDDAPTTNDQQSLTAGASAIGGNDYYNTTDMLAKQANKTNVTSPTANNNNNVHASAPQGAAARVNTSRTNPSVKYVA